MKYHIFSKFFRVTWLCSAALLVTSVFAPASQAATFNSYAEAVSGSYFLTQQPFVWVGDQPPDEAESLALWIVLDNWRSNGYEAGVDNIESFIEAYPNSAWAASLHANLGRFYLDRGRMSLALQHWEAAWLATRPYPDGSGKLVADYALANWTRLLASLGRYETLAVIYQETEGRALDSAVAQKWLRTKEAFHDMGRHPWHSYKCGIYALHNVAQALNLSYDAPALGSVQSPASGISVQALGELSATLHLGLVPVFRPAGEQLVVPSVVHWRQDHYAAIVAQVGNTFKVVDPTFGSPVYLSAEAINAEASGVFLAAQIPAGWRRLPASEASQIYGRGYPNTQDDADDQPCQDPCSCPAGGGGSNGGSGGNSGGSSGGSGSGGGSFWSGNKKTTGGGDTIKTGDPSKACMDCRKDSFGRDVSNSPLQTSVPGGMAGWRVSEPYLNLWLADQPLAYQPVKGDPISLLLAFKQRGEEAGSDMGIFNFSPSWNCSWLSYVLAGANPVLSADVLLPGGGYSHFELTSGWGTNYYNNFRLQVVTNGSGAVLSYQLFKPDGGKIIYDFFRTDSFGSWGYVFMTQQINSAGQATVFQYPGYDPDTGTVQLKYVIDGDGRTNTVGYLADDTYFKNRVGSVTDPFGRTASFGRAGSSSGLGNVLTNITDVVGINSAITYDPTTVWPTNLTTPYGTTTFTITECCDYVDRTIIIGEPGGAGQVYAFWELCTVPTVPNYLPSSYPGSQVPTNTPLNTLDNKPDVRNSFYWGRQQYATLPQTFKDSGNFSTLTTSDYLKSRLRHCPTTSRSIPSPSSAISARTAA